MLAPKFSLGGGQPVGEEDSPPTIIGLVPSKGGCSPRTNEQGILSRHRCDWQRRFDHQYDGYNFVPSKDPVCSERLNEGSFA